MSDCMGWGTPSDRSKPSKTRREKIGPWVADFRRYRRDPAELRSMAALINRNLTERGGL